MRGYDNRGAMVDKMDGALLLTVTAVGGSTDRDGEAGGLATGVWYGRVQLDIYLAVRLNYVVADDFSIFSRYNSSA